MPVPEPAKRHREARGQFRIRGATPFHRRPQIVMVVLEPREPGCCRGSSQLRLGGLSELDEVAGVAPTDLLYLTAGNQTIKGVLANGLQLLVPVSYLAA